MTVQNIATLNALATIAQLTYAPNATTGPVSGENNTIYAEITQVIDGPSVFKPARF